MESFNQIVDELNGIKNLLKTELYLNNDQLQIKFHQLGLEANFSFKKFATNDAEPEDGLEEHSEPSETESDEAVGDHEKLEDASDSEEEEALEESSISSEIDDLQRVSVPRNNNST